MQNTWAMTTVKWRALSLKRLAHLDRLQRTGRWRGHFPTEDVFEKALRNAYADADRWKQIAHQNDAAWRHPKQENTKRREGSNLGAIALVLRRSCFPSQARYVLSTFE